ncbi:MAG: hypothetical protein STSR0008_08660 [Ignavibacterium sp.]
MKKITFFLFILSFCVFAQNTSTKDTHPFGGQFVFSLEGGVTSNLGTTMDYEEFKVGYLGKGMIEYFIPTSSIHTLGIRAFGTIGQLNSADYNKVKNNYQEVSTDLYSAGAGLVYSLSLGKFIPYAFAGVNYLWFYPYDINDNEINNRLVNGKLDKTLLDKNELDYTGELGLRYLISDKVSVNLDGAVFISSDDNLEAYKSGDDDMYFTLTAGISWAPFAAKDSDKDGVPDSKDMCPETPKGVTVDEFGCPIDSDKDGVADYLDQCPETPTAAKVDKNGCPVDTDGDGVPDYLDLCVNTPSGIQVDKNGCPLDADGDGVADYLDKCPGTPAGVKVDKNGCPLDSDKDGVADYLDKCPNTPMGVKVDQNGCPIIEKPKEITLSGKTTFASGKSELLPSSYADLDKLIEVMKAYPDSKWIIEGHTDSKGSYKSNKALSLRRSESVMNYFVSRGIDKTRFEVIGMGPDNPIADNKTAEGRAMNRRVVIKLKQ